MSAIGTTPYYAQWIEFQENIRRRSDGTIDFEYHIMGDLGSEGDMLSALLRNRVQIIGVSHQSLTTQMPEFAVISAPFLFDSYEELDFILDEYLFDLFDDITAEKGLTLLQWVEVGWLDFYANRDIRRPEDVKNLRVRFSPNISAETFLQALGANAVPLGSADLVPALQQGMIDAGVTGLVYHALVTKNYASHYLVSNHAYDGGAVLAPSRVVRKRDGRPARDRPRRVQVRRAGASIAARDVGRAARVDGRRGDRGPDPERVRAGGLGRGDERHASRDHRQGRRAGARRLRRHSCGQGRLRTKAGRRPGRLGPETDPQRIAAARPRGLAHLA